MALKFYNTLSKRKEAFRPIKKNMVHVYNCGPTLYDYAHIGNFRAYIFADLLRRYLEWKGFRVEQIMNLTDVDDKTIKGSRGEGISLSEYTKRYEEAFFEDLEKLNIQRAHIYPRATKHIKEMIAIIKKLLERGIAYRSDDGIYYNIRKFRGYGKLSGTSMKGLKAGARVRQDEYDKESVMDFALWKFWDENDGDVFWETGVGRGRPGWHIECSAMSMKYIGETLDIHTGGVDLIFPHHENEIAQSEAFTGKQFVRYWLHNEHLLVDGKKMSKSLGNFYTLRDLLAKGHDPKAIRYLLLSAHYRSKLNLTMDGLKSAENTIKGLEDFMAALKAVKKGKDNPKIDKLVEKAWRGFEKAMDDDLNIAKGLREIFSLQRQVHRAIDARKIGKGNAKRVCDFFFGIDRVLGLGLGELGEVWHTPGEAEPKIKEMILKRESYRKGKKWKEADGIRNKLRGMGFVLEDTPDGPRWKKA